MCGCLHKAGAGACVPVLLRLQVCVCVLRDREGEGQKRKERLKEGEERERERESTWRIQNGTRNPVCNASSVEMLQNRPLLIQTEQNNLPYMEALYLGFLKELESSLFLWAIASAFMKTETDIKVRRKAKRTFTASKEEYFRGSIFCDKRCLCCNATPIPRETSQHAVPCEIKPSVQNFCWSFSLQDV